jgi:membrane protein YqaA with SNARE-associated domain
VSIPITVAIITVVGSLAGVWLGGFLQIRGMEHQIHYAKLHENRAEVVEHLYGPSGVGLLPLDTIEKRRCK